MTEAEHHPLMSSVVMLQLRDYARRPVTEQARMSAQLGAVLALLVPDLAPRQRIVLEGSSSAAVAVLGNPTAALALAERALRAQRIGLDLGIGIDHGPVELSSRQSDPTLAGDGATTAALMAAFAGPDGLLVTRRFRDALAQAAPGSQQALVAAGDFSDADLRTHQGFRLDRSAAQWRRRLQRLWVGVAVVLVLLAAVALRLGWEQRPRPLEGLLQRAAAAGQDAAQRMVHGKR